MLATKGLFGGLFYEPASFLNKVIIKSELKEETKRRALDREERHDRDPR